MRKLEVKLAALPKMKRRELEQEWRSAFGEDAPPAYGNDLLARAIAYRLQEKAYGGLSAATLYRLEHDPKWALEVINREGTSTVWDDLFESDDEAFADFTSTVEKEGVRAFDDSNVIEFPKC